MFIKTRENGAGNNNLACQDSSSQEGFCGAIEPQPGKEHCLVVFEDLHLPAMTHSAKGTIDNPGRNVRQKAGLNWAILDKGLGAILSCTEDKVSSHRHRVLCVPAPGTSITCIECGYTHPANRASRSVFVCKSCGYTAHADTNAAMVIRERGIKLALAGGTPVAAYRVRTWSRRVRYRAWSSWHRAWKRE